MPVVSGPARGSAGSISLALDGADQELGDEGYQMGIDPSGVELHANDPAGLFAGVQTLRQLLPASIESDTEQAGPWEVPGGQVVDYPRFSYRGAHLDVARHFFAVEEVKRFIDEISMYKVNHLHLHLTDDQGWRIQIDSWPQLTTIGGSTEVNGGTGGYYTKAEYAEIVGYAQSRYITVIPEIDMPGHTNAALASYAELNCDGEATDLYTGIEVGSSSLCVDKEITYQFVEDVISEVAAMTPGQYIHLGGDEAEETSAEEYNEFMQRVIPIVQKYGKVPMGWHEIVGAEIPTSTVAQYWGTERQDREVANAAQQGHGLIMSPADHSYLDMKYAEDIELGLDWAGLTSVKDSYSWNPGSYLNEVDESSVLGTETALWSETLQTIDDIEFMAFPRLPAVAELGWSPASKIAWEDFKQRLAAQGPRWETLGINFYRAPQVPWLPATASRKPISSLPDTGGLSLTGYSGTVSVMLLGLGAMGIEKLRRYKGSRSHSQE